MGISDGKKRMMITFDQKKVDRYQQVCKQLKMPQNSLSLICNEAIEKILPLLEIAAQGKEFTITDFFMHLGQQVQQIVDDEVTQSKIKEIDKNVVQISATKKTKRSTN